MSKADWGRTCSVRQERSTDLRWRSRALRGPAVAGDCLMAARTSALKSTRNLIPAQHTMRAAASSERLQSADDHCADMSN